jgi:hypothetical protein
MYDYYLSQLNVENCGAVVAAPDQANLFLTAVKMQN